MKKVMITMMGLMLLASTAMASPGNKLIDTSEAVTEALATFKIDNAEAVVKLFKGVRAAPGEKGVSLKIYLTDGTKQSYGCHRHEDSDPFECHQKD